MSGDKENDVHPVSARIATMIFEKMKRLEASDELTPEESRERRSWRALTERMAPQYQRLRFRGLH